MARSAADATRFTATGPHAYSKGNASTINISSSPPPPNETPQQKVARLREASRRAKLGQESTFDRVILVGRKWADRAHRITVTGLVGLSVVSIGIAGWSLGSMALYNRRKRREWMAEQQAFYDQALVKAKEAEVTGTLTPDLALVLNKERAILQAEEEYKNRKGIWKSAKELAFGGLAKTERPGGAMGFTTQEIQRIAEGRPMEPTNEEIRQTAVQRVRQDPVVGQAADAMRAKQLGGPLDRLGAKTAEDVSAISKSWTNWLRGR